LSDSQPQLRYGQVYIPAEQALGYLTENDIVSSEADRLLVADLTTYDPNRSFVHAVLFLGLFNWRVLGYVEISDHGSVSDGTN
jgi:hypothetical protein